MVGGCGGTGGKGNEGKRENMERGRLVGQTKFLLDISGLIYMY